MSFTCVERDIYDDIESSVKIAEDGIYLTSHQDKQKRYWNFDQIKSILNFRSNARDTACEIFFIDGSSIFIDLYQEGDSLDEAEKRLAKFKKTILNKGKRKLKNLDWDKTKHPIEWFKKRRKLWIKGKLSTFRYLLELNQITGRSTRTPNTYPIFPWTLSDYKSDSLDLGNPKSYRDLTKPIGALNPKRFKGLLKRYLSEFPEGEIPFLYGSFYSNAGFLTKFLIRHEPFTSNERIFQKGFDLPNRLFKSILHEWKSCLKARSDVRELIPEFFYFPDFLINKNGLNLGVRQNGEKVNHVELPKWAEGSPSTFIKIMKESLERAQNINDWIDLVFGYKQRGEAAIKAQNVFFHVVYQNARDVEKLAPKEKNDLLEQMINFGLAPKQILTNRPHSKRNQRLLNKAIFEFDHISVTTSGISIQYKTRSGKIKSKKVSFKKDLQYMRDFQDQTILHFLIAQLADQIRNGDISKVENTTHQLETLISQCPQLLLNTRDYQGKTPLFRALEINHYQGFQIAQSLINAGANPDIVDYQRNSPLHLTIKQRNFKGLVLLLTSGANTNTLDIERRTPLFLASGIPGKAGLNMMQLLLKHGANPNLPNFSGFYPLHIAAQTDDDIKKVKLLARFRAKFNVHTDTCEVLNLSGKTPLQIAQEKNHTNVKSLLETYQNSPDSIPIVHESTSSKSVVRQNSPKNNRFLTSTFWEKTTANVSNTSSKEAHSPIRSLDVDRLCQILKRETQKLSYIQSATAKLKNSIKKETGKVIKSDYKDIEKIKVSFPSGNADILPKENEIHMKNHDYETFSNVGRLLHESQHNAVDISGLKKKYWVLAWTAMQEFNIKVYNGPEELKTCPFNEAYHQKPQQQRRVIFA